MSSLRSFVHESMFSVVAVPAAATAGSADPEQAARMRADWITRKAYAKFAQKHKQLLNPARSVNEKKDIFRTKYVPWMIRQIAQLGPTLAPASPSAAVTSSQPQTTVALMTEREDGRPAPIDDTMEEDVPGEAAPSSASGLVATKTSRGLKRKAIPDEDELDDDSDSDTPEPDNGMNQGSFVSQERLKILKSGFVQHAQEKKWPERKVAKLLKRIVTRTTRAAQKQKGLAPLGYGSPTEWNDLWVDSVEYWTATDQHRQKMDEEEKTQHQEFVKQHQCRLAEQSNALAPVPPAPSSATPEIASPPVTPSSDAMDTEVAEVPSTPNSEGGSASQALHPVDSFEEICDMEHVGGFPDPPRASMLEPFRSIHTPSPSGELLALYEGYNASTSLSASFGQPSSGMYTSPMLGDAYDPTSSIASPFLAADGVRMDDGSPPHLYAGIAISPSPSAQAYPSDMEHEVKYVQARTDLSPEQQAQLLHLIWQQR